MATQAAPVSSVTVVALLTFPSLSSWQEANRSVTEG